MFRLSVLDTQWIFYEVKNRSLLVYVLFCSVFPSKGLGTNPLINCNMIPSKSYYPICETSVTIADTCLYLWPKWTATCSNIRIKRLPFNFPILILGIWGRSQRGRTFYPREYTLSVLTMTVKDPFVVKTKLLLYHHCMAVEHWRTW